MGGTSTNPALQREGGGQTTSGRSWGLIGEGSVDYDPIFACLASIGYDGYISLEDNNPEGHAGTVRAAAFVRRKILEHWGEASR